MSVFARALGAVAFGVLFTVSLGAWLLLHASRTSNNEQQRRRT